MKSTNYLSAFFVALVLAGCGGGGGEDAAAFSVLPSSITHGAVCPGGRVIDAVSVHTINGGWDSFRVRPPVGVKVGLASSDNKFVEVALTDGDLILKGRDPKFAIRASLACGSDVSVLVLDDRSAAISVAVKVESLDK